MADEKKNEKAVNPAADPEKAAELAAGGAGRGGEPPHYGEPDENGFIGVSEMYANYANETDAPLQGDEDTKAREAQETDTSGKDVPGPKQTGTSPLAATEEAKGKAGEKGTEKHEDKK